MSLKIHSEVLDVHTRLQQLGLSVAVLREVVQRGYLSRTRLTANHPRVFFGYAMWAETVAALRDNLRPVGWFKVDDSNYELTVNGDSTLAIAVTTGDEGTGLSACFPSNKCPKGAHTAEAIATNQQLDMFADQLPPQDDQSRYPTWVLLIHVAADEVRSELSLPSEIINRKIRAWNERIILPALPMGDDVVPVAPPDIPEIDVPVQRKHKA